MNLNNTKKCIIPWIHVNMEPTGDLFLCCRADQSSGSLGNVNTDSLNNIWNGDKYISIRNQMINDVEPTPCSICYETERLGGISKRNRENELWKDYAYLTNKAEIDFFIPYVDIRFNNICNLKCRTCRPLHSHSLGAEFKKLNKLIPHDVIIKHSSTNINDDLDKLAPSMEEIYFCGGEPLLMDEHYRLIDKLIDVGNFNVRLRYSTNLTNLIYKDHNILHKWKKFNNVSIHASLDGIGKQLEYIRHGTRWQSIIDNLNLIKGQNIDLKISPTVSVFNILDIADICKFYIDNGYIGPDDLGVTVLETPYYYSIQTLHPELKLIARDRINYFINEYDFNDNTKKRFEHLINYMFDKDSWQDTKDQFISITAELDAFRNEDFKNTFPELSNYYD